MLGDPAGQLTPIAASLVPPTQAPVKPGRRPRDPVAPGGGDERGLQSPHVGHRVAAPRAAAKGNARQLDDRVADQLSGAMEGHRAPPVDLQALGPQGAQRLRPRPEVGGSVIAPHRVHRGMLEQEQAVTDLAGRPGVGERALQSPGLTGQGTVPNQILCSPRTWVSPVAPQTAAVAASTWPAAW